MAAHGGLITREDLKAYQAKKRTPVRGTYRDLEVISMAPPSSGGTALVEMLNILEAYDLKSMGYGSAASLHLIAESMRRAFADRARHLADPDFNPGIPIERLTSKAYAAELRQHDPAGPRVEVIAQRASSGRRRATRPRTSRLLTATETPSRSPTPSRTATASRPSSVAPGSC